MHIFTVTNSYTDLDVQFLPSGAEPWETPVVVVTICRNVSFIIALRILYKEIVHVQGGPKKQRGNNTSTHTHTHTHTQGE